MKKHNQIDTGHCCINIFVDFDNNDAGCLLHGDYQVFKTLLTNAASDYPEFGRAFLDAALEYAHQLVEEEKGALA